MIISTRVEDVFYLLIIDTKLSIYDIIQYMDDNHPFRGRFLKQAVLAALGDTPVVLLHGARQRGKSPLARHIAATDHPAQYITLDDSAVLSAIKTDAAGFLAGLA